MAAKSKAKAAPDAASMERFRDWQMEKIKRIATLEAIVNTACEGSPEVEAAIRKAAAEVAQMDFRERLTAAVPPALRGQGP